MFTFQADIQKVIFDLSIAYGKTPKEFLKSIDYSEFLWLLEMYNKKLLPSERLERLLLDNNIISGGIAGVKAKDIVDGIFWRK